MVFPEKLPSTSSGVNRYNTTSAGVIILYDLQYKCTTSAGVLAKMESIVLWYKHSYWEAYNTVFYAICFVRNQQTS